MTARTERLEVRLSIAESDLLDKYRSKSELSLTKSDAVRELIKIGVKASMNQENYTMMRFQLMAAALNPGSRERINDAYLHAWDSGVYPVFHDYARWHKPFSSEFDVKEEDVTYLLTWLDKKWMSDTENVPTFYDLEKNLGVRSGATVWNRSKLIDTIRYFFLSKRFDEQFYAMVLKPMQHPTEASGIIRPFNRDEDLYFH